MKQEDCVRNMYVDANSSNFRKEKTVEILYLQHPAASQMGGLEYLEATGRFRGNDNSGKNLE